MTCAAQFTPLDGGSAAEGAAEGGSEGHLTMLAAPGESILELAVLDVQVRHPLCTLHRTHGEPS
jgi:hypothetical protein